MNNISEQLLSAVDILVDEKLAKLNYDKTFKAEVYSAVNLDSGEYKVRYAGNIFSAFANDITKQYKPKDYVYVTVPEGNFSNKKLIIGLVSDQSLSYNQMMALQQAMKDVSPTFDKFYDYDAKAAYGVIAGADPNSANGHAYIYNDTTGFEYHGPFQQYANNYELIRIKASFMTKFHSEHVKGNYGIDVEFYTKGGGVVSYRLDLNAFNGDPYRYSVYSPQQVIIKAQKNYLLGIKSVKLFEEGFDYDRYVVNGIVTENLNTTIPNIFVKDIFIQYVEEKNLLDNAYYLNISAPKGNTFTSTIDQLDLVGQLIYNGESILDEKNCKCQWYKRDLSVTIGSTVYNKQAGFGWRPIEANFNILTLDRNDVIYHDQYKLIVAYNSTTVLSAEINVFNTTGGYKYELVQTTAGESIQLQLINNYNDEVLLGDWYLSYPDGSYIQIADGEKKNAIEIKDYLLYSSVTFYCGVRSYDESSIVGIVEKTVTNSESMEDVNISYQGEDTFRYDSNGDITIEDSEKERTLQVVLTWKDGVGTSYRVEWVGSDGKLISGTRYSPAQSMIDNLWIDNSNILHYTIKQKYRVNFNDNTIQVRIITIDEQTYTFSKEILFLKDGDQGTNGTTYIAAIRPCDSDGKKLSGLQPLVYNNGWQNVLPLKCYVYKDGEPLNNSTDYDITYDWQGINVTLSAAAGSQVNATGQGQISTGSVSADLEFYVKVQVTVNDRINSEKVNIYASYPIDVAVGGIDYSQVDISTIPSYIKYTASGINPSFYSNNIKFLYSKNDLSSQISSLNESTMEIKEDESLYYLKPASAFIFERSRSTDSNIGVVKCQYSDSQYIIHPVVMYLDNYGNEAINGWDGTSIETKDGHVFAPQIGAGEKDSANLFTGVVMGKDSGQKKIGLYGYQSGVNTFGLMQDGKAFFGAKSGGGQIVIDGTSAMIYGGGTGPQIGGNAINGMTITLANLNPAEPAKQSAIKVGGGLFQVMYDGSMSATAATIEGTIYAKTGRIGCSSRVSNDGWIIETNRLHSGSGTTYVELNSAAATNAAPSANNDYFIFAGNSTASSAKFSVSKSGIVTAREGEIGGWKLKSNKLISNNGKIGLASSGTYRFWSGADTGTGDVNSPTFTVGGSYFWVDSSGKMSCKNAEVRGKIEANSGSIGGWQISEDSLWNGDTYLGSDGTISGADISGGSITIGDDFYVSSSGKVTANGAIISGEINADKGKIGGWTINTKGITSSDGTTRLQDNVIVTKTFGISGLGSRQNGIGQLGMIISSSNTDVTYNLGMSTDGTDASIILESNSNVALRVMGSDGWIILGDGWKLGEGVGSLRCTIPAENQYGIYARFA